MDNNNTPQGAMPQMRPAAQLAAQPSMGQPFAGRPVVRPVAQPTQYAAGAQPTMQATGAMGAPRPVTGAAMQPAAQPRMQTMARPVANASMPSAAMGVGQAGMNGAGAMNASQMNVAGTMNVNPAAAAAAGAAAGMAGASMNNASAVGTTQSPMGQTPTDAQKQADADKQKKTLLIGGIIGGAVLLIGIIVAIVVINMGRVDYSQSYSVATELKTTVDAIYNASDCEDVAEYADIASVPNTTYSGYINGCSTIFDNNAGTLITQLGQTAGVQNNEEIATQYTAFTSKYNAMVNTIEGDLDDKLSLYQAWHQFIVAVDSLTYADSTDEQFQAAAAYLTNTGNQAFVNYGTGWLDLSIQVANAYRTYDAANYNQDALYQAYEDKLNELLTWIEANRPNFASIAALDFTTASEMYTEFNKLYTLITDNYRG